MSAIRVTMATEPLRPRTLVKRIKAWFVARIEKRLRDSAADELDTLYELGRYIEQRESMLVKLVEDYDRSH